MAVGVCTYCSTTGDNEKPPFSVTIVDKTGTSPFPGTTYVVGYRGFQSRVVELGTDGRRRTDGSRVSDVRGDRLSRDPWDGQKGSGPTPETPVILPETKYPRYGTDRATSVPRGR